MEHFYIRAGEKGRERSGLEGVVQIMGSKVREFPGGHQRKKRIKMRNVPSFVPIFLGSGLELAAFPSFVE